VKIALCGPVDVRLLRTWLPDEPAVNTDGGTPVGELANALLSSFSDVEVLCVGLSTKIEKEFVFRAPRLTLRIVPARKSGRARDGFRYERKNIRRVLIQESPDVVHAHWTYEYALASLSTKLPTIVTVHDWAPRILRYQPSPYRFVRLAMNVLSITSAPFLAAPSPYIQSLVRRYYGRNPVLLPNLIADNNLRHQSRFFPSTASSVLAVNNGFSKFKNVHTLLIAFQMLRSAAPYTHLTLIGSGYEPGGPAERWAKENRLCEGVSFVGPISRGELRGYLDGADVFAHPSREESFGYVLLEAMSRGLPVVAGTSSGAVPWLLRRGEAGVLVNVDSAEELAAGIAGLLADGTRWSTMSEGGLSRARHFAASFLAPAFYRSYEKVIEVKN
jgi:L-malate glycosyltransferase